MSASHQQQSATRKMLYFGLIVVLFTVMTFAGRAVEALRGVPSQWTVSQQADKLQIRETSQGQAELSGSVLRLTLTGSRGFAVCALWIAAQEKQKRHEWNEYELIVRSITKLQPHFLTPWLFLSWNVAYNVSVESDRVRDKYFYISRGIEVLAEGERSNRGAEVEVTPGYRRPVGNPDMRFWIGFYYQNKFGVSDEANYLRSLFQMSLMDPSMRDPRLLRPDGRNVDPARFKEFCRQHPQLVKRLRDFLRCNQPGDVVDFIEDNQKIPTRYEEVDGVFKLKRPEEQFPVLPVYAATQGYASPTDALPDSFDNYMASQAWMEFASEPVPENRLDKQGRPMAEAGIPPHDPTKFRVPRSPMLIIFRQAPARCVTYVAERLQKEGWFDRSGWEIDEFGTGISRWFPEERVVVGTDRDWGVESWGGAYEAWRRNGERYGMLFDPTHEENLHRQASLYRREYNLKPDDYGTDLIPENTSEEMYDSFMAHRQLIYRRQNVHVTNYNHFLHRCEAEKEVETVQARKMMYDANRLRRAAEYTRAVSRYRTAFEKWVGPPDRRTTGLFARFPNFRTDNTLQEDLYERQIQYVNLLQEHTGPQVKPALAAVGALSQSTSGMALHPANTVLGLMHLYIPNPRQLPVGFSAPLDGEDPNGNSWIKTDIVNTVRIRLGLVKDAPRPPETPGTQPPPPPPTMIRP